MLRAIKIRLYPNKEQATMFNKLLGCYRVVYNQCLARKIKSYEETKISESLTTLGHFVHHELLKDDKFIWLREQNTKVLKQAVKDMLTCISVLVDERVYDDKNYPNFEKWCEGNGLSSLNTDNHYAENYQKWKNFIGGDNNVILKSLINKHHLSR